MNESLYFGAILMAVGMTTVFILLAFVVLGGKLTILVTNMLASKVDQAVVESVSFPGIETSKIAAISAAVKTVTRGKGNIKEIKKM